MTPGIKKQKNSPEQTNLNAHQNTPWEAQEGWVYIGHGEWNPIDSSVEPHQQGPPLEEEPQWIKQWLEKNDEDIRIHRVVTKGGYPNRWGQESQSTLGGTWRLCKNYCKDTKMVKSWNGSDMDGQQAGYLL